MYSKISKQRKKIKKLINLLLSGYNISEACILANFPRRTFYHYYDIGKEKFEKQIFDEHTKFYLDVENALLEYKKKIIDKIMLLSEEKKDWRGFFSLLTLRFREDDKDSNITLKVISKKEIIKIIKKNRIKNTKEDLNKLESKNVENENNENNKKT